MNSKTNHRFITKEQNVTHIPIRQQIRLWAAQDLNLNDMVKEYERCRSWWENKNFLEINKTNILKDLAKSHRHDVLEYIIEKYPKYMDNVCCVGFTPLHSAVWKWKNIEWNEKNIVKIKKTLDVLLNNYKFRILSQCQSDNINDNDKYIDSKYETILGAIYEEETFAQQYVRDDIYNYIIDSKNDKWYMNDFQLYMNKLNKTIFNIFLNKILFIMNQYFNKSILIFFKNILSVRMGSKMELNSKIDMLALIVVSKPNNNDKELNKYFENVNIDLLENRIIKTFINDDETWLNKEMMSLSEDADVKTYLDVNYKNIFSFYGSLYKFSDKFKVQILEKINNYVNKNLENINKYILHFILHSNIDLKNMNSSEKIFISTCVNKYYDSKNIRFAVNFENVFKILLELKVIKPCNVMEFA